MSSRIIPKEQLTAYQRWELLGLDDPAQDRAAKGVSPEEPLAVSLPTAEDIERLQQQAAQEGFKAGHEEGYKAGYEMGRQAAEADVRQFSDLLESLSGELQRQDERLARELLDLALAVAKQMLHTALDVKEGLVLDVLREAVNSLPALSGHMRIMVHPDDLKFVSEFLAAEHVHLSARAMADPRIERGGFRIETSHSEMDGELHVRWQEIIDCLGTDRAWLE
jgi:flagellar assembly protein FliH